MSYFTVRSYGPDMDFGKYMYMCTVTLTLAQGNGTPLGHGQLCEILSRSMMVARIYGPDMDFGCVCPHHDLTLKI